jgi:aminopeptidase N
MLTDEIQAYEVLSFNLLSVEKDVLLDFKEAEDKLKAILINGKSQEIIYKNEHIILPREMLQVGYNKVEINFMAGESSLNRKEEFLYTLFVPDRARTAFPLFDQPNLKAKFKLILDIPANWQAISNAPIELLKMLNDRKSITFRQSDLMSSYLFSFVAGEFKTVRAQVNGREMTMLHRETDFDKVERNKAEIFRLHANALQWMESYTGIKYPFQKFDFVLIPGFQYGGMEHVGAIQYRANSLFLDEDASDNKLLSRASLIAHETAHMWFGDLVTMDWFNDVWTKEVFANFMAAKMVNPSFPDINHDLNFLLRHYPSAYGVDRTEGANAIRQDLANLNEAGQMYGAIIYNKAPIMMRQLEMIIGEKAFRRGMQNYLNTYADKNATWPDLIQILDQLSPADLKSWSQVWVNSPGRPTFTMDMTRNDIDLIYQLSQHDTDGDKTWPQLMSFKLLDQLGRIKSFQIASTEVPFEARVGLGWDDWGVLFNADGIGYGLYPPSFHLIKPKWESLNPVEKGSLLVQSYEQILESSQGQMSPRDYLSTLKWVMKNEENQLLINEVLRQVEVVFWNLLDEEARQEEAVDLEGTILSCLNNLHKDPAIKKTFFNSLKMIATSQPTLDSLYRIWSGELSFEDLNLSENDQISLASILCIKLPEKANEIVLYQTGQIKNPDSRKRFEFISPSLSADEQVRDEFFEALNNESNRQTESWVLMALSYLHHPLRVQSSVKYLKPSLDLLQEIQVTGDIFFPKRWLDQTLTNHHSEQALKIVEDFIEDHPDYNQQLRMKVLQAADFGKRANAVQKAWAKK